MAGSAQITIKLLADVRQAQQAMANVSRELRGLQGQTGRGGGPFGAFGGNSNRQGVNIGRSLGQGIRNGIRNGIRSTIAGGGIGSMLGGGGVLAGAAGITGYMLKSAYDFTEAWTNVEKVVTGSREEMDALKKSTFDTAHAFAVSPNTVAGVMTIAGQMNIPMGEMQKYTETMLAAGLATDMTSESAANMAGQFSNAMRETDPDKWTKIISTVDQLADVIPGGESKVMDMAQRLALAGKSVGLSSAAVLGYSAFITGVGVDPEMGGSALSRMFIGLAETGSAARGQSAPDPAKIRESQDHVADLSDDLALAKERRSEMYSTKTGKLLKQYRKHPAELMAADMNIKRLEREQGYAREAMDEATHPGQKMAKAWAAMAGMSLEEYGTDVKADPQGTMRRVLEGLRGENEQGNLYPALGKLGINDIREIQTIAPMVENLDTPGTGLDALLGAAQREWSDPSKLAKDVGAQRASDSFQVRQGMIDVEIAAIQQGIPLLHQAATDIQAAMKATADVAAGNNPFGAAVDFFKSVGPAEKAVAILAGLGTGLTVLSKVVPAAGSLLAWIIGLGGGAAAAGGAVAAAGGAAGAEVAAVAGGGAATSGAVFGVGGAIGAVGVAGAQVGLAAYAEQVRTNLISKGVPEWLANAATPLPPGAKEAYEGIKGAGVLDGVTINVQTIVQDAAAIKDAVIGAIVDAAKQATPATSSPVPATLGGNY